MDRFIVGFPVEQNNEALVGQEVEMEQGQEDGFQQLRRLVGEYFEHEMAALPQLMVMVPPPMGPEFNYLGVDPVAHFRFSWEEIHQMAEHLQPPEWIGTPNRYVIHREEALCLVLYRMSWPTRLLEVENIFGRSPSALSTIFNYLVSEIHDKWKHLLLFDHVRLTPGFMERCVAAVDAKGGLQPNCWSFIDGTHMRISRPGQDQREFYSGHKRVHSLKYHAISTPDGMMVHFGGPFPGRYHDARMLSESRIREYLAVHAVNRAGDRLFVYGDEGYGRGPYVLAPHRGNDLPPELTAYNQSMRRPRLAAEWGFAFISNNWGFLKHYTNLRIGVSPIGLYAPIAALFSNLHSRQHNPCLLPNEGSYNSRVPNTFC